MLAVKVYTFLFRLSQFLVRWLWKHLPESILSTTLFRACGKRIHEVISRRDRKSVGGHCRCTDTRFFRNIALLEVLRDLAAKKAMGAGLSIASIGCSTGAELYSLLWFIRSTRPDLEIKACGLDVSKSVIAKASAGTFSKSDEELAYLSDMDVAALFDSGGEILRIKPFLSRGLKWLVADALDSGLSNILEPQDLVLANNFIGPFFEEKAEKCLFNISRIVKPSGYLVLFGMDLDLRARWVKHQGYLPITDRIEQVHVGDRAMLDWPWTRWGLEPLDKGHFDWQTRYAVVFQNPDLQIKSSDSSGNKPQVIHN
jgi:chemotaxis methyl-accepting protein methylase